MQQNPSYSHYKSGFQIFIPIIPINQSRILFTEHEPPALSYYLINTIILHSHELQKICSRSHWDFETTNQARMLLGLHFEEFHLIETSLEAVIDLETATKLFHYIRLYLEEGIHDIEALEGNRPFYKTLLYWVSKRFNQYILNFKAGLIKKVMPVLTNFDEKSYQDQESYTLTPDFPEIAAFVSHQSVFKDLKHKLKKEGANGPVKEKSSWKTSFENGKLTVKNSIYKDRKPIELLLEGKVSSLVSLLRPRGYNLRKIQESVKYVSLYYLSQGHFSLDYSCFLMEQVGLNLDKVLYEYYDCTLRRDVRKKIQKYFKAKGKKDVYSAVITSFLKMNEYFTPLDSITIALRRRWAERLLNKGSNMATQRFNNLYNLWEDSNAPNNVNSKDNSVVSPAKVAKNEIPVSLAEFVELANSFVAFTFEMDDFIDESAALYLDKEYALTRHFRKGDDMESEKSKYKEKEYGNSPFSLDDFKAFDRKMHEINLKRNHSAHQKFKPKVSINGVQKLFEHSSVILSNFLGRTIEVPQIFLSKVNPRQLSGYFQFKVNYMHSLEPKQMLAITLQKLDLDAKELMVLFSQLTNEEQPKYFEFLIEYAARRRDLSGLLGLLNWALHENQQLFQQYFSLQDKVISTTPNCQLTGNGFFIETFQSFIMKNGLYFDKRNIGVPHLVSLLARDRKFSYTLRTISNSNLAQSRMPIKVEVLHNTLEYLAHSGLIFTFLEFFKRFDVDVDDFLMQNDLNNPTQKSLLYSLQREKSFGKIISLCESRNAINLKKAFGLESAFVKSDRDLYWEYLICHMKYGRETVKNYAQDSLTSIEENADLSIEKGIRDTFESGEKGGLVSFMRSDTPRDSEKSLSVFEVFKPGSLISYFLLEHITQSEEIFSCDIRLPVEDFLKAKMLIEEDQENKLASNEIVSKEVARMKTICALILFGLPFTAFVSIYSVNPPYGFLFSLEHKRSMQEQLDLTSLCNLVASVKEPKHDGDKNQEIYEILKLCFEILLRRPFDLCFFNSYLALIKLLRLNPEFFLVNISVYRRIFIYLHQRENTKTEEVFELYFHYENIFSSKQEDFAIFTNKKFTEENNTQFKPLTDKIEIFVEIYCQNLSEHLGLDSKPSRVRGTKLIEILQYLEQATKSMENVLETVKDMEKYGAMVKETESPWGLVSKFCTLHSIPSSLKLLNEIALKNDWLRLLLELDVQKCSVETAREFISKYFHHTVLKRHLMNSLEELAASEAEGNQRNSNYKMYSESIEEGIMKDIKREILEKEEMKEGNVQEIVVRTMLKVREIFTRRLEKVEYEGQEERLKKFLHIVLITLAEKMKIDIFCLFALFAYEKDAELAYFKYLNIGKRKFSKEKNEEEIRMRNQEEFEEREVGLSKEVKNLILWCNEDMLGLLETTKVYFGKISFLYLLKGVAKALNNEFEDMNEKLMRFEELFIEEVGENDQKKTRREMDDEDEDDEGDIENSSSSEEEGDSDREDDRKQGKNATQISEKKFLWKYLHAAEFIENFVERLIQTQVLDEMQVLRMLESFYKIRFSKTLEDWYINLNFIQRIKQRIESHENNNISSTVHQLKGLEVQDLVFEPFEIYILLLEHKMFNEANLFSVRYGFEQSYIGLVQIHKLITENLKNGKTYNNSEEIVNHKHLIDAVILVLLQSKALVYQSAYYLKYLTSIEGFSLWDQIYLLSISHRLMEQLPRNGNDYQKFDKFRKKVKLQKDVLLYAFFHRELRKYFFEHKQVNFEKVLFQVENNRVISNVNFSHQFETLLMKAYINALSNFDSPFIDSLNRIYGIFIQEKEIYMLWKFFEDNLVGKTMKITLKVILELLDFSSDLETLAQTQRKLVNLYGGNTSTDPTTEDEEQQEKDKTSPSSSSSSPAKVLYPRQRDPQFGLVMTMVQTFARVKQTLHEGHDLDVFMRGYLYYCRIIAMSLKNDPTTFSFFSLQDIFNFSKKIKLKQVFDLLLTSAPEERGELLTAISFMLEYNNIDTKELICEYFNFAQEELAASFEMKSFLDQLKRTNRYNNFLRNIYAFAVILDPPELRLIAGKISINYLKCNHVSAWSKTTLLGLAYYLLSDSPHHYQQLSRAITLANQSISTLLSSLDIKREKLFQDGLDQINIILLIFEWNSRLLWTISEQLGSQGSKGYVWKELFKSLGPLWGRILVEKTVRVGHNLPLLEIELQDSPLTLAHLVYAKAKKYLARLLMDLRVGEEEVKKMSAKKRVDLIKRIVLEDEDAGDKEGYKAHMNLIASQLVFSYRYYCLAKAEGLARKTVKTIGKVYSFIEEL